MIQTATFFALSAGLIALGISAWRTLKSSACKWVGLPLLAVAAVGVFFAGVYPMDPLGAKDTTQSGLLHGVGTAMFFLPIAIAPLLLSLASAPEHHTLAPEILLGSVLFAVDVFLIVGLLIGGPGGFVARNGGLFQRVALVVLLVWMCVYSAGSKRSARTA